MTGLGKKGRVTARSWWIRNGEPSQIFRQTDTIEELFLGTDHNLRVTQPAEKDKMDREDGLIWVYGVGDEGVMAFTDFGIETLQNLIQIYKEDPDLLKRSTDPL